jgi:hypothetical protein
MKTSQNLSDLVRCHCDLISVLGSAGMEPRILRPRHKMKVSGQIHAPAALPQGKSQCYPLDRRLGGAQSLSGRGGEEKNSQTWIVYYYVSVYEVVPVLN